MYFRRLQVPIATTALFSSVPLGRRRGNDDPGRASFGARVDAGCWRPNPLRILIVVVSIPSIYAALRLHGADPFVAGDTEVHWPVLAPLLAATAVGGFVMQKLKAPNAFVLGALAACDPTDGVRVHRVGRSKMVDQRRAIAARLRARVAVQSQFLTRAPRFVGAVALTVVLAMILSALFAIGLARMTGLHPATLVLATAPGAWPRWPLPPRFWTWACRWSHPST